jgi:sulfur-carrier protein adenylyltransferase/sulfurtransferase
VFLSKRIFVITWVLLLSTVAGAYAASPDEIGRVTAQELKAMMDSGTAVVIVDNRPKVDFDRMRVKGAVSLPWDFDVADKAKMILPLDKLIVTYCACGPGESDSAEVGAQLLNAGFKNVKTLKDGWEAWEKADYPVEGSQKR